jgi:hypothetical protein
VGYRFCELIVNDTFNVRHEFLGNNTVVVRYGAATVNPNYPDCIRILFDEPLFDHLVQCNLGNDYEYDIFIDNTGISHYYLELCFM